MPEESSPTPPAPPVRRWRWWVHLVLLAGYVLTAAVPGLRGHDSGPALSDTATGLFLGSALELGIFGLVFAAAWFASRVSRDALLLRWPGGFRTVLLGFSYSVALRVALMVLLFAVSVVLIVGRVVTPENLREFFTANRPDVESLVDLSAMRDNPYYFWLSVTWISFVVAGFREELWRAGVLAGLRALWPRQFDSRRGRIIAVAVAAVIFGIGHLPMGPLAVCLTALLGFGLGLIMVLHRSLWVAALAHGFFDAATMALLPWVDAR